jgi:hypothetical protein
MLSGRIESWESRETRMVQWRSAVASSERTYWEVWDTASGARETERELGVERGSTPNMALSEG